jgi:polysaccharide export outer membrane protein
MKATTRHFQLLSFCAALILLASPGRAQADQSAGDKPKFIYTLTSTDRIRISIFQEDDLDTESRVDALGNVNLPLIGDVKVAGYTVDQAQKIIEQAYRDGRILRKPQVTISIEDYAPREVSIQGQVKAPGRYLLPIESTFSVVELVTKAGGFTDIAKGSDVTITHIGPDGQKVVHKVDVESIIQGEGSAKAQDESLLLQPGDIVYVPERII